MNNISIDKLVRAFRKARGLTQEQLAKKSGCSLSAIKSYETGRRVPKTDAIVMMAEALEISPALYITMLGDTNDNAPQNEDDLKVIENIYNSILNDSGRKEAYKQIHLLSQVPQFQSESYISQRDFEESVRKFLLEDEEGE